MAFSDDEMVPGAAEAGTGGRGEQSRALDGAGEGLRATEDDGASGKKPKRGKQLGAGK